MIVDIHTHIFPDKIAETVLKNTDRNLELHSKSGGTLGDLKRQMDAEKVEVAFVLAVAPHASLVKKTNEWLLSIQDDQVKFLGTIHPDMPDWETELIRLKKNGIKGIKFNALIQKIRPDDQQMYPIYEKMVQLNLVALFHSGASYKERNDLSKVLATPQRIAKVNDLFPKLKIIAAHYGGNHMMEDVELHLLGRNLFIDTSYPPDVFDLDTKKVTQFIKKHSTDRVLFGTDFPWETMERGIRYIDTLDLTQHEKDKILGLNAQQLLSI
jgi:predicted TIM-barrel fold metal-dependent hydrolase